MPILHEAIVDIIVFGFNEKYAEVSEDFEFAAEMASQRWIKKPDGRMTLAITEGVVEGYFLKNAENLLDIYSDRAVEILKKIGAWEEPEEGEEPEVVAGAPWPEELVEPAKENGYSGLARPMINQARYDPPLRVRSNNILVFDWGDLDRLARWNVRFEVNRIVGQKIWPVKGGWKPMVTKGKLFRITECP